MRELLSIAPPAVGGDPSVNPADFRVTEFATGLNFPTGLLTMPDGSLLASINVPTDPSNANYYSTTGEIVRFDDSTGSGVADNNNGTVLYNGLPAPITDLQQAGPYIIVTTIAGEISFLHTGATASSPLTFAGSINLAIPSSGWEHQTYGLAVRPTPGVAESYDVLFNLGSEYNGVEIDSQGNVVYSNGVGVPVPTTSTVPVSGLISGTLNGDSIYMVRMTDDNGTPSVTDLTQVATGLRNAASMSFDSAGNLYLADNGIDGNDGGYYGFSTDTLQMIPAAEIGNSVPNFGFPYSYTPTNQAPGEPVTAVNPSERVTPLASFEPLPDKNLPGTGSRSQGAAGFALSPPDFPTGLNNGIFIGFHGLFDAGGTGNDKNPVLFVNPTTGNYFDFISNDEPNIGHIDGAASTSNSLFLSDIASNGQLWGSPSPGIIYEITAINEAPLVSSIPSQTTITGKTLSVQVDATTPVSGQTITYSIVSGPAGATINPATGMFTWTPPPGVRDATVEVAASNDGPTTTQQFTITVAPLPPTFTAIPPQSVSLGSTLSVQISAVSPGQAITYMLAPGAPANATINPSTGLFTWTPQLPATNVTFTVIAADSGSPASQSSAQFKVTVLPGPAPRVSLGNGSVVKAAKMITLHGSFFDPLSFAKSWTGTVNYGDGSATSGISFKANKAFTIHHTYKSRGNYTLTLNLTDNLGDSGTESLAVIIGKSRPSRALRTAYRFKPLRAD